jgi:isoquinoline 1-oxidoreductase subunit alpha
MSVASMLKEIPEPTDEDINAYITNICRCGTYTRIRKAIKRAAALQQ